MVLELLLIVVLAAHLLATNLATGGPLMCLWTLWRERHGDQAYADVGRRMAAVSMIALAVAIVLGGAAIGLIALLRPEPFFRAAGRIPTSRYWFGIAELVFYFVCLEVYRRGTARGRMGVPRRVGGRAILLVLAGTDLAYHFPPLLALIGVASTERGDTPLKFTAAFADPQVMALVAHFLLASIAVAGVSMAAAMTWRSPPVAGNAMVAGGRMALAATLLQFGAGTWLLVTLPDAAQNYLLGDDLLATLMFAASIVAAVALLYLLAGLALFDLTKHRIWTAVALTASIVVMMVATQDRLRRPVREPIADHDSHKPLLAHETSQRP